MDLRTLRAFVEVVRQGGFSAAAKSLNSTQPTVSKAVRQLEDEIGASLLDRLGHRIHPTAAGEMVYRRAIAMLAERENLQADLADLRGLKRGRLQLGLSRIGSSVLFAPLFAQYRSRYPGVEIQLIEHGSLQLEQLVEAGELELGVSLLPVPENFCWQLMHDDPLMALLPPGHHLEGRSKVRLVELADSPFIMFETGFALNPLIEDACRRRGFVPHAAARSGQADFIMALVAAGLGVALLPKLILENRVKSPITCALLDEQDLRWRAALAWRQGTQLSPPARAWIDLAREVLKPGLSSG